MKPAAFRHTDLFLVKKAHPRWSTHIGDASVYIDGIDHIRTKAILGGIMVRRIAGPIEPHSCQSLIGAYPKHVVMYQQGSADVAGQSLAPRKSRDNPSIAITNYASVIRTD